jgi:hypothetical protein
MNFRKKPVIIEAMHYETPWGARRTNAEEIAEWIRSNGRKVTVLNGWLHISTPKGIMLGAEGDWIIKGIAGEFCPCKRDIFEATYEPVMES